MLLFQIYFTFGIIWSLYNCYAYYKRDDLGAIAFPGRVWLLSVCFTLNLLFWPVALVFAVIYREK